MAEVRGELLLELGSAAARNGDRDAVAYLTTAREGAVDAIARVNAGLELLRTLAPDGRAQAAADVLIESLAEAPAQFTLRLDAEALILAQTTLAARAPMLDRVAQARADIEELSGVEARALQVGVAVDLAFTNGSAHEATTAVRRALADGGLVADLTADNPIALLAAHTLVMCDELDEAEALLDETIEDARARGSLRGFTGALCMRAQARNHRGLVADAEADARLSLENAADRHARLILPLKLSQLADALIERGRTGEAAALLTPTELARHDPESQLHQPLRDSRGRLLLLQGDPAGAIEQWHALEQWEQECATRAGPAGGPAPRWRI